MKCLSKLSTQHLIEIRFLKPTPRCLTSARVAEHYGMLTHKRYGFVKVNFLIDFYWVKWVKFLSLKSSNLFMVSLQILTIE